MKDSQEQRGRRTFCAGGGRGWCSGRAQPGPTALGWYGQEWRRKHCPRKGYKIQILSDYWPGFLLYLPLAA